MWKVKTRWGLSECYRSQYSLCSILGVPSWYPCSEQHHPHRLLNEHNVSLLHLHLKKAMLHPVFEHVCIINYSCRVPSSVCLRRRTYYCSLCPRIVEARKEMDNEKKKRKKIIIIKKSIMQRENSEFATAPLLTADAVCSVTPPDRSGPTPRQTSRRF